MHCMDMPKEVARLNNSIFGIHYATTDETKKTAVCVDTKPSDMQPIQQYPRRNPKQSRNVWPFGLENKVIARKRFNSPGRRDESLYVCVGVWVYVWVCVCVGVFVCVCV